ncbi:hypothetical protein TNCV_4974701 [Trichonephila clavipes]|uniref:Uncharacterized protein n=1 Tax=Trichonephila clavipes TaxID=2585209 RepID=A0A8X6SIS3_TRICX|nr:hypothetical protein TNCV_4974701 [Trichonephila clavipes]
MPLVESIKLGDPTSVGGSWLPPDKIKMGRTILLERRQTKSVGRWDDCPSSCDLIGRGHSLAESGRGNGLGRYENKRPETGRS